MVDVRRHVKPGSTEYFFFDTFDGGTGASITMSGLALADIKIYKDGGTTERGSTSGYALLDTDGIDFDAITGAHGISIDLSDNTTANFWEAGSQYDIWIDSITVDSQTVSFHLAHLDIGYAGAIVNTTIASLAGQTSFTLEDGSADNDAYNGCPIVVHDLASGDQVATGLITDYVGSTKTVTLYTDPGVFTMAAGDSISIFPPANAQWLGNTAPQNLSAAQVGSEVDSSLSDIHLDHLFAFTYNPASKPGVSDSYLNELVESDGGVTRFTSNALEQGPAGGSGLTALASGTAQGGTSSTIQLASAETFADDELNGNIVKITSGTGAGQARVITDYVGSTDTATISPDWTTAPDATSVYEVVEGTVNLETWRLSQPGTLVSTRVQSDLRTIEGDSSSVSKMRRYWGGLVEDINIASATSTTAVLNGGSSNDDEYNGMVIFVYGDTGFGQARVITDYVGSTQTATIDPAWGDTPDATSDVLIMPGPGDVRGIVDAALVALSLDHLLAVADADDVVNDSVIAKLAASDGDWSGFSNTDDSLEAIRDRGDAAWITGGGGGLTQAIQPILAVPPAIDLANTASVRIGIILTNTLDDLPTTAEITPGTISIWRKAQGGTSWSNIVNAAAMSEQDGFVYYDEVFDSGSGYADGDMIRIQFESVSVTADTNTYNITGATGVYVYSHIVEDMRGTDSAYTGTPPTAVAIRTEIDSNSTQLAAIVADTSELQTDDVPGLIAALNDPTAAAIADAVWDELQAGHVTAGSFGEIASEIASILTDTGTTLDGKIDTIDTVVDAIKAVTDLLPDAGALTSLATAASIAALNDIAAADVWAVATRTLTANTNLNDPTAAAIADAVLDEALSGHITQGTLGAAIEALVPISGAVNDAGATTTDFDTDGFTEASDDHFNGSTLTFTSGALKGQSRVIVNYVGTGQNVQFDRPWTEAPANNDEFIVSAPITGYLDGWLARASDVENNDTVLNSRSAWWAIAKLMNRIAISGSTLTIYEDDDVTSLFTQTLTTNASADPITEANTD